MQLDISSNSLPIYEALASSVRLELLRLISAGDYSITELSKKLNLSKAIITKHIQKLEAARLITSKKIPGKSGVKKIPHLAVDTIEITFPTQIYHSFSMYTTSIQLGHYTNFEVVPTCGLATAENIVGKLDDPLSFVEPSRVNASLLWFSEGYVEYKIPTWLTTRILKCWNSLWRSPPNSPTPTMCGQVISPFLSTIYPLAPGPVQATFLMQEASTHPRGGMTT